MYFPNVLGELVQLSCIKRSLHRPLSYCFRSSFALFFLISIFPTGVYSSSDNAPLTQEGGAAVQKHERQTSVKESAENLKKADLPPMILLLQKYMLPSHPAIAANEHSNQTTDCGPIPRNMALPHQRGVRLV